MSSYDDLSAGTEVPRVVELYEITAGDSVTRYAASDCNVEFGGHTYTAATIERGAISSDSRNGTSLSITAPPAPELARYIRQHPARRTTVSVLRLFDEAPDDFRLIFRGRVMRVSLQEDLLNVECEAGSGILGNKIPRMIYSAYCQHELFDAGCGLKEEDFREEIEVEVIGGTLFSTDLGTRPDGYYSGGFVRAGDDYRWITYHEGPTIYLAQPFDRRVVTGDTVEVYPGCDGSPETCRDKFNNLRPAEATGLCAMPYIPDSNPVIWGFK